MNMRPGSPRLAQCSGLLTALLFASGAHAQAAGDESQRLDAMRKQLDDQTARLEALKRDLAAQEAKLVEMRRQMGLEKVRGAGTAAGAKPSGGEQVAQAPAPKPVGQAPETSEQPRPQVAPIFEQPGVLTPKGKYVLEPSLQYSYSSNNRVALVGYTVIPALVVGLIDVREVKRNTFTAAITGRLGITNRFEIEGKIPYVYRNDDSVSREILSGASQDRVFNTTGNGIGDVEFTGRYQLNEGGVDKPFYVGGLRFKTRTGKDQFDIPISDAVPGARQGLLTELPRGSGFYTLQPSLTALFPSDPAVLFGSVSYQYNFKRDNVIQKTTNLGDQNIGKVEPGGVFGFNVGMGLALNERTSFSLGYDHQSVGKTKIAGQYPADAVRVQLGTLLLGYSYRLDDRHTLNFSLGAGLTRDTPDITLTLRMPTSF